MTGTSRSESAAAVLAGLPPEIVERFRLDQLPLHQLDDDLIGLTRLTGRRAVVTGGGGPALGSAVADRLAALGAIVTVIDIDGSAAARVAEEVGERRAAEVFALEADVADWDGIHRAIGSAAGRMGGLDILVNNAGGLVRHYGPFAGQDAHAMRQLVDLNLMGTLYATHAALDEMLPRRRGRVVTISSEGAKTSMTGVAIYNACKSAVVGFTGNLARELRGTGVTTVAVCPGPMIAASDLGHFGSRSGGWIASLEQIWDRLLADRFSFPEEVANMVAFLAGDAGAYVQGTAVSVGGGLSD